MKKIYIMVLLVFAVSVFLFVVSFFYLDKHNHTIFYYNISVGGQHVGTVKADKFVTEDKLVYKSTAMTPFSELFTEKRIRLELDRRYDLQDYQKDIFANGASCLFYAEKKDDSVSFLSKAMSKFIYLSKVRIRRGTFVFEEDSPATYLPIVENYDFKVSGAQGFNSLIYLPDNRVPPIKRFVTLTSMRDEYLKIGRRKIKTVNLLLKIKGLPTGNIWVAKSDRSLLMIDIPSIGLKITRSFEPKDILPCERLVTPDGYIARDVVFNSKSRQLSGTLTMPAGDLKYPAVLLVWGEGPQDRDYQGFFRSIAEYLPKYGYAVLRFDKRGIGASAGDAMSVTTDDELDDIAAAISFLRAQNNVNPDRVAVIAHSEGALNALRLAANEQNIKGVVLMAPSLKVEPQDEELFLRNKAAKEKLEDEYVSLAMRASRETKEKVDGTKNDWGYMLGKRCYLKAVRSEEMVRPAEVIANVGAPIVILQGRNDLDVPPECAARLDKAFSSYGKMKHSVAYFDALGHFFGALNNDGLSRMYYLVDKEVLAAIRDWLNLYTVELVKEEASPSAA